MIRNKFTALTAVLVILALTACSNTKEVSNLNEPNDNEGYEVSSTDLLVDTLQYLLNDGETDNETTDDEDTSNEATDNETSDDAAVDNKTSDKNTDLFQINDNQTEQQDDETNNIKVTIYYGNAASDKLNSETADMEELTAENLINALVLHNIVSLGTKINSFEEETVNKGKTLHLDLDKSFREYLKTMSSESEKIILACVTATFLEAYDAESIKITIDGDVLKTNYEVYEEPFKFAHRYIDAPKANE